MNNNEPIVLGKVKKGSAGKPLVVLIVFLFLGAFILFLPTIISYFGDYNIVDLIKNGQIIDFFKNHDNYVDKPISNKNTSKEETKEILINNKSVLKGKDFTLNNFNLTKENIKFTIIVNNEINFDEKNYYLILSQNDKKISIIKINDIVTNSIEQTFNFKELLNDTVGVKGIIKEIKENDYPSFIVSSDESGLGSLTCEKDNYKIEYILNNNNLIRIKETLNYIDEGNREEYYEKYQGYTLIMDKININGGTASLTENYSGFIFTSDIDLSTYNNIYKNDNYYSLNTKTNIINFEMNAKGYDCK